MKKYIFSAGVVVIVLAYILFARTHATPAKTTVTSAQTQTPDTTTTPPATSAGSETINPAAAGNTSTPTASAGQWKDGTYTGPATDAFYGMVQVSATISGGKLASIQFLQYPSDRRESQDISSRSMPKLISEAIAAQSPIVDVVSGATQTSEAFAKSLNAALAMAK